jgi:phosphoenolpyruvate carboxykinase (ATP)
VCVFAGDDEHGWDDEGVFNFEGGCYAKTIDLDRDKEPEIWDAIRTDALLENVAMKDDENVHGVDFADTSKTPNGRVAYPLHHIPNHEPSGSGGHPNACIFLTCDAFGVLPPVARLSTGQAMYHFISGFTAKVAGTERGITAPVPTFSACFGGAFLPLHPTTYATLLEEKLKEHDTTAYLVNTGWSGGAALNPDGTDRPRMDIPITRGVITAILDGSINDAEWSTDEYFGFEIPSEVNGVESAVLNPAVAWEDKESFDETSRQLCEMFAQNFKQYEDGMGEDLTQFGPVTAAAAATTRSSVAPLPAAAESERESSWLGGAPQPVLA